MEIRPIKHQHVALCVEVFLTVFNSPPWDEAWPAPAALKRLEDLFKTPEFFGLLAADGTEVVGFAMGHSEHWDRGFHFYLKEMCVVPHRQQSGIGSMLMQALCGDLEARQVEKIYLLTARGGPAERFYTKQGFYVSQKLVMMGKYLGESGKAHCSGLPPT